MAFLIIAGITIPVSTSGATKKAPIITGNDSRAYDGSLRSTVRAVKRSWQFTTKRLADTFANSIETAVNGGAFVTCSGDALGGSVTCRVTCGDGQYTPIKGGFKRTLALTLVEV